MKLMIFLGLFSLSLIPAAYATNFDAGSYGTLYCRDGVGNDLGGISLFGRPGQVTEVGLSRSSERGFSPVVEDTSYVAFQRRTETRVVRIAIERTLLNSNDLNTKGTVVVSTDGQSVAYICSLWTQYNGPLR